MKRLTLGLEWIRTIAAALLLAGPVVLGEEVADHGWALGMEGSTLGTGARVSFPLHPKLNGRLTGHYAGLSYRDTVDDKDYDVKVSLGTAAILLDWYPGPGKFCVSGGLVVNGNDVEGSAVPRRSSQIGNNLYTPEEIGTLRMEMDFPAVAGYLGFGFGHKTDPEAHWAILLDFGVMFGPEPDISLTANGSLSGEPGFEADLALERENFEDDYGSVLRFYPVLSLGLGYRF